MCVPIFCIELAIFVKLDNNIENNQNFDFDFM